MVLLLGKPSLARETQFKSSHTVSGAAITMAAILSGDVAAFVHIQVPPRF